MSLRETRIITETPKNYRYIKLQKKFSVTLHQIFYLNLVKCHICLMICTAHTIYSGDKIENKEISGTCGTYGGKRDLLGKTEGNRLLGRPRHRFENNIKMDLQEVECEFMDWIEQHQTRNRWWALVKAAINLSVL